MSNSSNENKKVSEQGGSGSFTFLDHTSPVSVVIPTYNRFSMLSRLLESLKITNFPVKEIIVVDDASSDPSYSKLKEEFPFIKYVRHKKVMYVGESRNDGIRLSSGKYIFMVDDDNIVHQDCIGELVSVMEADKNIGVAAPVTCYFALRDRVMYAGSRYSKYMRRTIFLFKDKPYSDVKDQVYEADGFANSYMFRREAVIKVYPIPKSILFGGEDGYIQFRIKKELNMKLILVGRSRVFHDFMPNQMFSRLSPFKLYYAIRGKITFEKNLDTPVKKLLFSVFIPGYFIYYLQWALRTRNKIKGLYAVSMGLIDGLFSRYIERY